MEGLDAFLEIEKYSHLLLGRLAIEHSFITYRELLEALYIQHKNPKKRLGTVLVKRGYMSLPQLKEILEFQKQMKEEQPSDWPYIPDTVLKGMHYFSGYTLGEVKTEHLHQAEELREEYLMEQKTKPLTQILIEDMHIITRQQIEAFQRQIAMSLAKAPCCSRIFTMYNYSDTEEIPCPICWDTHLVSYKKPSKYTVEFRQMTRKSRRGTSATEEEALKSDASDEAGLSEQREVEETVSAKAAETTVEKGPPPGKREAPALMASPELLDLYAAFQNVQPHTQKLPTMDRESREPKAVTAVAPKVPSVKPEAKELTEAQKQALSMTARMELQRLYQEIEQTMDASPRALSARGKGERHGNFTENQTQKIHVVKICVAIIAAFSAISGGLVWYFARPGEKRPSPYILEVVEADTKAQAENLEKPRTPEETPSSTSLKPSVQEGRAIPPEEIEKFQRIIQVYAAPHTSEAILQDTLKQVEVLIAEAKQSPYLGDYYHVKARVLCSLVWIDKYEKLPPAERKKRLKEAIEAGQIAEKIYGKKTSQTKFALFVMPWMREATTKEYKVNPWDRPSIKNGATFYGKEISYESAEEAGRNMEKYVLDLRDFLKEEESYVPKKTGK